MAKSGAAAVIIGNEVLSAKVTEANGALLIQELRKRGIALQGVYTVPDDVDAIVEALMLARRRARWVFTSGGIGPTHDDVTVRAVALALGRDVVRMPEMVKLVEAHFAPQPAPAEAYRLAESPTGSELLAQAGARYPVLHCDGVYMLPGVPQLFKLQLQAVLARLEGTPLVLRNLYLNASESEIAKTLDGVAMARPQVMIGSYPTFDPDAGYKVKITIELALAAEVEAAEQALVAGLAPGVLLRRE
jgi:molybdenum cofactor synthesis domain-containing protein